MEVGRGAAARSHPAEPRHGGEREAARKPPIPKLSRSSEAIKMTDLARVRGPVPLTGDRLSKGSSGK